jgi:hypothetical protein
MTDDRGDEAAARRRAAEQRAAELQELRKRLEGGGGITAADVQLADRRLMDALHRAEDAHNHAISAHQRAAARHREAADLAQQVGQPNRVEHHTRAADSEDSAAVEERAKREADHRLGKRAD